ncbi:MAG TPA: PASTA domain-containing protein [Candidatus Saccharimonadaceae bacterium]|jgi:hypothetical protein|nr:PASTA domain-containing protein [Candidatus Saccharimonadaceae bacterium]
MSRRRRRRDREHAQTSVSDAYGARDAATGDEPREDDARADEARDFDDAGRGAADDFSASEAPRGPERERSDAGDVGGEPSAGLRELDLRDPQPERRGRRDRARERTREREIDDFDYDSRIEPNEIALAADPSLWIPSRRHRVAVAFSLFGLAIMAFVVGLFVFNNLVMPRFIHRAGEVKVPDLANLTLEQGERLVAPLGLQLSRSGERFDPSVPTGFILSQDPAEGTPVRGRHRIMVVVSLGEEFSSVPELFGESPRGARLLLERAGLRVGGETHAPSDEVGEGLIVDSDPPSEAVLPRGTPIALMISNGAGPEDFVMPDLLGREISGVRRQLEAIGFRVYTPPAAPSVGTVMFQDPPPGARITHDANIMLQATGRVIR